MKLLLLSLALLGLGAIGGYITFHLLLSSRCSHLLVETESRQKTALKELQAKNQKVTEDYHKCMHDEGTKQQLLELQGRLEAQNVFLNRHQELTRQYDTMQQDHQRQLEEERRHHASIVDEQRFTMEQLQAKVDASASSNDAMRELDQAHQKMEVTRMDMEHFRERLDICVNERQRMEREVNQLLTVLQERDETIHQLNGIVERLEQERDEEYRRRFTEEQEPEQHHYDHQEGDEQYEEQGGERGEEEEYRHEEEGERGEQDYHHHDGGEEQQHQHEEEEEEQQHHHGDHEQGEEL